MSTPLNRVILFIVAMALFLAFAVTGRGQEVEIPAIPSIAFGGVALPIELPDHKLRKLDVTSGTGFQLTSTLEFQGFMNGIPLYRMGTGVMLLVADPVLLNRLRELEDQKVTLNLKPTN